MEAAIKYNRHGRMTFNPEYHKNTGTSWSMEDISYLINYYDKIGVVEMSFALERTETSIIQKVVTLRKAGVMVTPKEKTFHRR